MAANKFNKQQREAHLLTVAEQYLAGQPQSAIAEKVGVNQSTISRYLRTLQTRWQAQAQEAFEAKLARELARIDRLEREHWEAWARSQQDAETVRQKQTGKGDTAKVEAEKTTRGQVGDPRFLDGIQWCIEQRLKIMGAYAPTKLEVRDWRDEARKDGIDPDALKERLVAEFTAAMVGRGDPGSPGDGTGAPGG